MELTTKFDFKDKVFSTRLTLNTEWKTCEFCGGKGRIVGFNEVEVQCPVCYGRKGQNVHIDKEYIVSDVLTIGEVRIEEKCENKVDDESLFDNYGSQEASHKEQYMCYETGIGSGSLWNSDTLFRTKEEAQAKCDELNKALLET